MPNRILKDSICVSKDILAMSWFEEVFFYRLIVTVDDFGCYFASPAILKGKMFPRDSVTDVQIEKAINKLSSRGIVRAYTVEDESYLEIVTWGKHQKRRAQYRKYPAYEESDEFLSLQQKTAEIICKQWKSDEFKNEDSEQKDEKCRLFDLKSSEIICEQMKSNVPEESRNRGIEESRNEESYYCTERSDNHSMPEPETFIELPLNDKTMHQVTVEDVDKYEALYPSVDVKQELRNMFEWLDSNPKKRKTRGGIKRFITNWLSREQNKGGSLRISKSRRQENEPDYYSEPDFIDLMEMQKEAASG